METAKNIYLTLKAIGFYPEVALAALGAYFIVRQRYDASAKWAVWVPVVVSFIGQMAFNWPDSMQDIFMAMLMCWLQAGVAIGAYSFIDKYGLADRAGKLVQKKMEDKDAAAPADKP